TTRKTQQQSKSHTTPFLIVRLYIVLEEVRERKQDVRLFLPVRVPKSKYNLWSTRARFLGSLGYNESSLPYWSAKYERIARLKFEYEFNYRHNHFYQNLEFIQKMIIQWDIETIKTKIRHTFKNSGVRCSPAIRLVTLRFRSTPKALAASRTERHGALPGKMIMARHDANEKRENNMRRGEVRAHGASNKEDCHRHKN
ncbi:hypothetical protein C0J52_23707, partial [Blattella germanica]